jgi:hypothetical protein
MLIVSTNSYANDKDARIKLVLYFFFMQMNHIDFFKLIFKTWNQMHSACTQQQIMNNLYLFEIVFRKKLLNNYTLSLVN